MPQNLKNRKAPVQQKGFTLFHSTIYTASWIGAGGQSRAVDKVWRRRPACGFWRRPAVKSGTITGRDARLTRRRGRPMPLGFGGIFFEFPTGLSAASE